MPPPDSRYRPDGAPDYSHRFHAGNVGDVWKHCALAEVLRLASATARVRFVDTHAGEGRYPLGATGEWTEGIARLWHDAARDDALGRYVALCRRLAPGDDRPRAYPGSPVFARAVLGPEALLVLHERDAAACTRLRATLADDRHAEIACDDGLAALAADVRDAESRGSRAVALVDPPWSAKGDWITVPDAVAGVARASRRATVLLWYPVKSLTRPNAMIARLEGAGVPGAIAEVLTTPLAHRRQRLNGSGVLLVRPPAGALEALAAAAPVVGARCATRAGTWSFRAASWGVDRVV